MAEHGTHAGGGRFDAPTGMTTTGHTWDGIEELNTPLPRWWLWLLYATHIWALVYILLYPAIPLVKGATTGLLGWNSRAAVEDEIKTAELARADVLAKIRDLPIEEVAADPALRTAAFRGGQSAFKVNCVQCHKADATGGVGYANLNDDDWLWGGSLEAIQTTLQHGIRYAGDAETRDSQMPAFGADGLLEPEAIGQVAQYVLSLSGKAEDQAKAEAGAPLYAENCAACHGEAGEGNRDLGAPKLNDAVWLYGSSTQDIEHQINRPRHGIMPAWGQRLDPTVIKELAIYVHGLGGGEAAAAQ